MRIRFAVALAAATIVSPVAAQSQARLENTPATCYGGDFGSFFEEFARSSDVRQKYTDSTIKEGSISVPNRPEILRPATPGQFDIAIVDNTWAETASVERWEKDRTPFTRLSLDMKEQPGGSWRVEYQPAIFRNDETLKRKTGKARAYIFAPMGGCWKLVGWLK